MTPSPPNSSTAKVKEAVSYTHLETEVGHGIGVDSEAFDTGGHQLIQRICFQGNLHIFPYVTHIYRNHHSNTVCGAAILFRSSSRFVDCLLYRAFVDVGISVDSGFHRCGLTGGGSCLLYTSRCV